MSKAKAEVKTAETKPPEVPEYFSNPVGFALDEANKWLTGEALDAPKATVPVTPEVKDNAAERVTPAAAAPPSVVFNLGDVFRVRKPKSKPESESDDAGGTATPPDKAKGKTAGDTESDSPAA